MTQRSVSRTWVVRKCVRLPCKRTVFQNMSAIEIVDERGALRKCGPRSSETVLYEIVSTAAVRDCVHLPRKTSIFQKVSAREVVC